MNDLSIDHDRHDVLLVAAHAAGDLAGNDAVRARALVRDCRACAALAADLGTLTSALRDLPQPPRPRDFTLSPADAARHRRPGWWRLRDLIRRDGLRLARPLGAGLASLGLAGLLFASTVEVVSPPENVSVAAGAPAALQPVGVLSDVGTSVDHGGARAGGDGESAAPLDAQQQVAAQERDAESGEDPGGDAAADGTAAADSPNDAMIVVSGSLFIVGMGLVGLRWTADRLDG